MTQLVCRRAQDKDWQQIKEIARLAFEEAAKHPEALNELADETWFDVGRWVVAEADGRIISALGLRPGVMWMQGVAMPTATVGTVGTLPEMRGKGIGLELVRFAGEVVKEEGLVLSRLHTSATRYAFYGRAGYVKAITGHPLGTLSVEAVTPELVKKSEADLGDGVIRPAHARDAARLNEIYEATFSKVTGCLSRNEHFFLRRIARKPKLWYWSAPKIDVVETPGEGVVAYAACAFDEERQELAEVAVLSGFARMARPLTVHVAREAQRRNVRKITTYVDRFEPLGWLVHEFHIDAQPDASVLFLQVHDAPRFLEIAQVVLERACARHEVELTLSLAGIGGVTVGRGTPVRIVTDAAHLAALLYNGAWLAGLLGQGALFVHPDTRAAHEAVRMVFPETNAYRCRLDGY